MSILSNKNTLVILAFGQSNSANWGDTPKTASEGVYNYHEGKLYAAVDPLLGGDGDGGSVWTRLGEKILQVGYAESVVFISLGKGGSRIARWSEGGDLHRRLMLALDGLQRNNLKVTHLLWHQGETDAEEETSAEDYKTYFLKMLESIRKSGIEAPIYVSIASRCGEIEPNIAIQSAQKELVNEKMEIRPGPNTDELDAKYRYDDCHFSNRGLEKVADLWFKALF